MTARNTRTRFWTAKERQQLVLYRERGDSLGRIAYLLDRSPAAISAALRRWYLVRRGRTTRHQERRSAYLHALTRGLSNQEIAALLGVTLWSVWYMRRKIRDTF